MRNKLRSRFAAGPLLETTEDKDLQIENAFLQKINRIVENNLAEAEFSVNELCQELGMSRSQLFRKLKALTDKSIVVYIRSIRLHHARQLLAEGNLNVSEVAYKVGFNDPLYFSRAFSQEFGFPPTEVRSGSH